MFFIIVELSAQQKRPFTYMNMPNNAYVSTSPNEKRSNMIDSNK